MFGLNITIIEISSISVVLITGGYLIFLGILRVGLFFTARSASSRQPHSGPDPMISIIVAARNEQANLSALLQALRNQSYPAGRIEVVVANDHSEDQTWDILVAAKANTPNLKPVNVTEIPPGWSPKKWALKAAIKQSTGAILMNTDADCIPPAGWVRFIADHFSDPAVGLVYGPAPLLPPHGRVWQKMVTLDSYGLDALAAGSLGHGWAFGLTGRNLAYRRAAYDEVGGFDDISGFISGDDDLMFLKIAATQNWRLLFALSEQAVVKSNGPETIGGLVRQRMRHASKGRAYFKLRTPLAFRLFLIQLYLSGWAGIGAMILFGITQHWFWLAVVLARVAAEYLLIRPFTRVTRQPLNMFLFLLTGLVYPFYIVAVGTLGSLVRFSWKGRSYDSHRTA